LEKAFPWTLRKFRPLWNGENQSQSEMSNASLFLQTSIAFLSKFIQRLQLC
jgi:hypothetical protein